MLDEHVAVTKEKPFTLINLSPSLFAVSRIRDLYQLLFWHEHLEGALPMPEEIKEVTLSRHRLLN